MATAAPKGAAAGVTLEVAPDVSVPTRTPGLSTGLACLESCKAFKDVMANDRRKGLLASEGLDGVAVLSPGSGHLLELFYRAYSSHYALELAPHDVHQVLRFEFNKYVVANAEALRHLFVAHEGQTTLAIDMEGRLFGNPDWPLYVHRTVRKAMPTHLKDPGLAEWFIPQYSNTPPLAQTVAGVTAMSTMQAYFKYKCCFSCGLPRVTLTGTPEDWRAVRASIERLRQYVLPAHTPACPADAMARWCDALAPVLDQFVSTVEGRGDPAWWNRICQYHGGGSGPTYYTGWATVFHPFGDKGQWLPGPGDDAAPAAPSDGPLAMWFKLNTEDVTSGVCRVPVEIDDDGEEYMAELFAGQLGAALTEDGSGPHPTLRPVSGWAMYLVDRVPDFLPQRAARATPDGYVPLSATHERARALLARQAGVRSADSYFHALADGLPGARARVGAGQDAVVGVVDTALRTADDAVQLRLLGSGRLVMVEGATPVAVECPPPVSLLRVEGKAPAASVVTFDTDSPLYAQLTGDAAGRPANKGPSYHASPNAMPIFLDVPHPKALRDAPAQAAKAGAKAAAAPVDPVLAPVDPILAPLPVGRPEGTWRHWRRRLLDNLPAGRLVRLTTAKGGAKGTVKGVREQGAGVRLTLAAQGATSLTRMPVILDHFFFGKEEDPELWVQEGPPGAEADDRWARVPSYVRPHAGMTADCIVRNMKARAASGSRGTERKVESASDLYWELAAGFFLQGHKVRANGRILDVRLHTATAPTGAPGAGRTTAILESATGETHRVRINVPAGQAPKLELLDEGDGTTWLSLPPLPAHLASSDEGPLDYASAPLTFMMQEMYL